MELNGLKYTQDRGEFSLAFLPPIVMTANISILIQVLIACKIALLYFLLCFYSLFFVVPTTPQLLLLDILSFSPIFELSFVCLAAFPLLAGRPTNKYKPLAQMKPISGMSMCTCSCVTVCVYLACLFVVAFKWSLYIMQANLFKN